jgi:hypothetical protein
MRHLILERGPLDHAYYIFKIIPPCHCTTQNIKSQNTQNMHIRASLFIFNRCNMLDIKHEKIICLTKLLSHRYKSSQLQEVQS